MDLESILDTIQPFLVMFVALFAAFLTAIWISSVIWAFRDIRARSRDIFAHILATLMVLLFFPLFPLPGLLLYLLLRPRETLAEIYERTLEEEALLQGIEERLACPTCNRRIEEDFAICPACHTRLKKACPACGRLLHLSWTICAYCGAAQTAVQAPASLHARPPVVSLEPTVEIPRLAASSPPPLDEQPLDPEVKPEAVGEHEEVEQQLEGEPTVAMESEPEAEEPEDWVEPEPATEGEPEPEPETEQISEPD